MVETAVAVQIVFRLSIVALLLVVALHLAALPNASTARRLMAAFVALTALREVASIGLLVEPPWADERTVLWLFWYPSVEVVLGPLLVAILWAYPRPPRLRSVHTAVLAFAFAWFVVGALAWFFARDLILDGYYDVAAPWYRRTAFGWMFYQGPGPGVMHVVAVASALVRARSAAPAEARAAWVLVPLLDASSFTNAGIYAHSGVRELLGHSTYWTDYHRSLLALPDDCCGVVGYLAAALPLPILAIAFWLAIARRSPVALGLVALGFLLALADSFTGFNYFPHNYVWPAMGILYAMGRHGALGGAEAPRRTVRALAIAVGFLVFLVVDSATLGVAPDSPVAVTAAVGLGGALGLAAALALSPGHRFALVGASDDAAAERAIDIYRSALEGEIDRATDPREISTRLRRLRAELGITEAQHAIMEVTLRGASRTRPAAPLAPGSLFLHRYRVEARLGGGGAADAYRCRDERIGRAVVIKVFRGGARGAAVEPVLREARSLARVQHPNVVALIDVEELGDAGFIVMEHVDGGSLADRLRRGPLAPAEFARVARGLLAGLAAVHAEGIVHRDVKPGNVLLTSSGSAKLADFGVARTGGADTTLGGIRDAFAAVGTIPYMSPEVARGREASIASDVYAAGATLYEAWTGRPYLERRPGEGGAELQMRAASLTAFEAPFEGPPALRTTLERALAPWPADRPASAAELAAEVASALAGAISLREAQHGPPDADDVARP